MLAPVKNRAGDPLIALYKGTLADSWARFIVLSNSSLGTFAKPGKRRSTNCRSFHVRAEKT